MAKKSGLGRGLSALLDDTAANKKEWDHPVSPKTVGEISLQNIEINPFQPREDFDEEALNELAASIAVHGIIQPITVRELSHNQYQIISGERRVQASKKADLKTIPAYIRKANDQQMLEMALIENIQRENLNAMEVALSYQRLIKECNLKQEQLGERVGKKRATVTNYLRLLKLPEPIQLGLREGHIAMGHARALIAIDDIIVQLDVYKMILEKNLSVRQTEEWVRKLSATPKNTKSKKENHPDPEIIKLQSELSSHFGTKINMACEKGKGHIKIPFHNTEELNRILDIIKI